MKNYLILFLLLFGVLSCKTKEEKLGDAYKKSVAWMWNQQGADGGWHSETHAVLRDGKALTPYILYYLLQVPSTIYPHDKESIRLALRFIQKDMEHSMKLEKDSLVEFNYPNYSAAYALRVLYYTQTDTALQKIIAQHLLHQQFFESRNVQADQLAYGGWGYGEPDLEPGEFGHVDISHTRRILEALTESHNLDSASFNLPSPLLLVNRLDQKRPPYDAIDKLSEKEKRIVAAELFLASVQRVPEDKRLYEGCTDRTNIPYDGGFVSSMYTLSTNKCQPYNVNDCYHYPSYATATCDGILALHALGLDSSKEFHDARQWLEKNQNIDVIDGLSKNDPEQWYQIMHYYHWSVRAEAMRVAGIRSSWEKEISKALIREQQPEGFYINPLGGVNKEDDPLLATIFCVQAFTNITLLTI